MDAEDLMLARIEDHQARMANRCGLPVLKQIYERLPFGLKVELPDGSTGVVEDFSPETFTFQVKVEGNSALTVMEITLHFGGWGGPVGAAG